MKFTNNDLEKIKTVLNLSEKEFIELIENNDIVKMDIFLVVESAQLLIFDAI